MYFVFLHGNEKECVIEFCLAPGFILIIFGDGWNNDDDDRRRRHFIDY